MVKEVLESRWFRNQLQYLLDSEGCPPSERSWEPARNLGSTPALKETIRRFHVDYPSKPGPGLRRG
ncbi:hypothetical protein [Bacillus sp. SRB_331]|uniref:hypothetical protein n=1 Tax=Bacillus sp. SRB_331 TaxID=1969379 RepID=UPI0034D981C3